MDVGPSVQQNLHTPAAQMQGLPGCRICLDAVLAIYLNIVGIDGLFVIVSFRCVEPTWI